VLDGLTPSYLSAKEKILEKSKNVWLKQQAGDSNDKLKVEFLRNYGVRFYHQEILNASQAGKCDFFVAPYLASP
jgi:hypothetical protein